MPKTGEKEKRKLLRARREVMSLLPEPFAGFMAELNDEEFKEILSKAVADAEKELVRKNRKLKVVK